MEKINKVCHFYHFNMVCRGDVMVCNVMVCNVMVCNVMANCLRSPYQGHQPLFVSANHFPSP
jgi:hypothetical protein